MEKNEENKLMSIRDMIYEVKGQKVMLDSDLAELYGVEVKRLNEAVKRNIKRFPLDFMFQLTGEEWDILRSQIVIAKEDNVNLKSQIVISSLRSQFVTSNENNADMKSQFTTSSLRSQIATAKNLNKVRFNPYVFTEQGVAMLSSVLHSEQAIEANIQIMRAFVQMRHYVLAQGGSSEETAKLHKLLMLHIDNCDYKFTEHDKTIEQIIEALNNLIEKPKPAIKIGFGVD